MKNIIKTLLAIILSACSSDNSKNISLSSYFQKGPFIVGSEITIQELDEHLISTGKNFITETTDNVGSYSISMTLTEDLVEVSSDGFYFNEVSGE